MPDGIWAEVAESVVAEPDFDVHGGMAHNFTENHFDRLSTAAETQIALGIVGYWAETKQEEHLIFKKSFPAVWWAGIKRRCVEASLQFGVCPSEPLIGLMMQVGRLDGDNALVQQLLTNFAEVNLNLRANEMDPINLWENWDKLLCWGDEWGLRSMQPSKSCPEPSKQQNALLSQL